MNSFRVAKSLFFPGFSPYGEKAAQGNQSPMSLAARLRGSPLSFLFRKKKRKCKFPKEKKNPLFG
jgi:hypothetical protein